jgi:hypothetical protein
VLESHRCPLQNCIVEPVERRIIGRGQGLDHDANIRLQEFFSGPTDLTPIGAAERTEEGVRGSPAWSQRQVP